MDIIETQEDMDNRSFKRDTVHFLVEKERWMDDSWDHLYPKPRCGQQAANYATKDTQFVTCIKCRRNIGISYRPPVYRLY